MHSRIRRFDLRLSMLICAALIVRIPYCFAAEDPESQQKSNVSPSHSKTEGFELTISTTKKQFEPCEPIVVKVVLSNATAGTFSMESFGTKNDYKIYVTDESGKEIPRTRCGEAVQFTRLGGGGRRMLTFSSGESLSGYITVNQIFDMSVAGSYSIVVKHAPIPTRTGKEPILLTSDPIEIEVSNALPWKEGP